MTIWKRWIQRGVLCGLVLGGFLAFATIASASEEKPPITDHAAMAAWYDREAAHNRDHAKDMMVQKELYLKDPSHSKRDVVSRKIDFVQHCDELAGMYTRAAEKADLLAQGHRDMLK